MPVAGNAWNWILGKNMHLPGLLATMCTCTAESPFCKLRSVCRFYTLILELCSWCDPLIGISLITSIWRRVLFPWSILASKSSTHELELGSSHVVWKGWCKKTMQTQIVYTFARRWSWWVQGIVPKWLELAQPIISFVKRRKFYKDNIPDKQLFCVQ